MNRIAKGNGQANGKTRQSRNFPLCGVNALYCLLLKTNRVAIALLGSIQRCPAALAILRIPTHRLQETMTNLKSIGLLALSSLFVPCILSQALPDAPSTSQQQQSAVPEWMAERFGKVGQPLTTEQKFARFEHRAFGPQAFVLPALHAGLRMANPPKGYPPEWTDGGEAFGRLYGSTFARQFTKHSTEFAVESTLHYDARYFTAPPNSSGSERLGHAIEFVFVQKTDRGRNALALPHLAGAAAGAFVGMAYLPDGYNDAGTASKQFASELAMTGVRNVLLEFSPEIFASLRRHAASRAIVNWMENRHSQTQRSSPSAQ